MRRQLLCIWANKIEWKKFFVGKLFARKNRRYLNACCSFWVCQCAKKAHKTKRDRERTWSQAAGTSQFLAKQSLATLLAQTVCGYSGFNVNRFNILWADCVTFWGIADLLLWYNPMDFWKKDQKVNTTHPATIKLTFSYKEFYPVEKGFFFWNSRVARQPATSFWVMCRG